MVESNPYPNPRAVEQAIATAAHKAHATDPSTTVQEFIQLEYFHRFLSRIFSEGDSSDWVLKGGTGMLARVASARGTTDIDLYNQSTSLEYALSELDRLATLDLGDYFRFQRTGYTSTLGGNENSYTDGYQVSFDVYIGAKKKGSFHVDLVTNVITTDEIEVASPANAMDLPRLKSNPYRLYPIVDQVADKICATLDLYHGAPSSREKDLVDLVVIATTHNLQADKLSRAIRTEAANRAIKLPQTFSVPESWGTRYTAEAGRIPACANHVRIEEAKMLMATFIDPILAIEQLGDAAWNCETLRWVLVK